MMARKMEREEAWGVLLAGYLASCKVQRKEGPGSSSSGFPLLIHVAWSHTDSQEWQTELSWKSRGWGSAGMKG